MVFFCRRQVFFDFAKHFVFLLRFSARCLLTEWRDCRQESFQLSMTLGGQLL